MPVLEAISDANRLLPGQPAADGASDPRWQAIIAVAEHIPTEPEGVWTFVRQWGSYPQDDLRDAIATCVLEHLLEHHFDTMFPRVEAWARSDPAFADTVSRCWAFGQGEVPVNAARFRALLAGLRGEPAA